MQIKYLGLIYDNKLNWKYHIEHINILLRKFFSIFKILRQFLDIKLLNTIYLSLVNSVFSYSINIWGGTFKTHSLLLCVTINSLIKYILKKPYLTPTSVIYKMFNVNNLSKIHRNHLLLLLYKYKHLIDKPNHNYNTRFKENKNVNLPKCNKLFGSMSPLYI